MLIDEVMPEFDATVIEHVVIDASAQRVYDTAPMWQRPLSRTAVVTVKNLAERKDLGSTPRPDVLHKERVGV